MIKRFKNKKYQCIQCYYATHCIIKLVELKEFILTEFAVLSDRTEKAALPLLNLT